MTMTPSNPMSLEQMRDQCIAWIGDVACNGSLSGPAADDIRNLFDLELKRRESEARDRVAIALREPNSAKAAQVASSLGASHPPADSGEIEKLQQALADISKACTLSEEPDRVIRNYCECRADEAWDGKWRAEHSRAMSAESREGKDHG
jgi:hypothetical protein